MNNKHYEVKIIYYPQIYEWQIIEVDYSICADEHRRTLLVGEANTPFEAFKNSQIEINKLTN